MANEKSFYITLDECIKKALVLCGETNPAYFQRFMQWASMCVNELGWDVSANLKRTYLPVDNATQSATLPDDFVQWTRVGLVNSNNEFMPLQYNDSLITNVTTPDCHCDCGCNDEVCQSIGNGSFTTTTTDGVTTSICTKDNGDIVKKTCRNYVNNPTKTCNYSITFVRTASELTNAPYTSFKLTKNNVESFVGDVTDSAALTSVMTGNGFSLTSSGATSIVYGITATTDVWDNAIYTDSNNAEQTVSFTQSGCVQPTATTEEVCVEETICNTTILPCGCIEITEPMINVLQSVGNINISLISRWRYLKDFSQTFKTPPNSWGEFNINPYDNTIVFNFDYQYSQFFLEYYSANEVDSKDYLVPVMAERPIMFYCKWMMAESRSTVSQGEKHRAMKLYYNEKRKYRERVNPARVETIMNSVRVTPRP